MTFDGRAVANYILDRCEANGREVTNLSLQKIVYFSHIWSLIELGRPLLKHKFEAWQYGPVLQYLYRQFRSYDKRPIEGRAKKLDPNTGQQQIVPYEFDQEISDLQSRVVDFYSPLSAGHLVALSHSKGGPWHRVWNHGGKINPGMKIDDKDMIDFYSKVVPPYVVQ